MDLEGMDRWELERALKWRQKRLAAFELPGDASISLYIEYDRLRSEIEDLNEALRAHLTA